MIRRIIRDCRGVTAIEFALVGAAFMTLLVSGLGFGLMWWTENGLQTTAVLTARCASIGSCADPKAFAISTAGNLGIGNLIQDTDVTVVVNGSACYGTSSAYSQFTKVTINSTAWVGVFLGPLADISLSATACFPNPHPS